MVQTKKVSKSTCKKLACQRCVFNATTFCSVANCKTGNTFHQEGKSLKSAILYGKVYA